MSIFDIVAEMPVTNEDIIWMLCVDHLTGLADEAIRGHVNYFPNDLSGRQIARNRAAQIIDGQLVEPTFPTTNIIPDVHVDASAERVDTETIQRVIRKFNASNEIAVGTNRCFVYLGLDERFLVKLRRDHVSLARLMHCIC